MNVGFVGYSAGKFDEAEAQKIIDEIFDKLQGACEEGQLLKDTIAVVSGATYMGIPAMIYDKASELGIKTIGVMCKDGYDCDLFPCDEVYAIGDNWGDESETFINMIDIMFRIGGGPQSLKEVQDAKQKGISVIEYELPEIKS